MSHFLVYISVEIKSVCTTHSSTGASNDTSFQYLGFESLCLCKKSVDQRYIPQLSGDDILTLSLHSGRVGSSPCGLVQARMQIGDMWCPAVQIP